MFRATCFFVSASVSFGEGFWPSASGCLQYHSSDQPEVTQTDLWCPGAHGVEPADGDEMYKCYRIPSVMRTGNGTILAFIEARKENCADGGWIDILLRRSFDNGETWTQSTLVYSEGSAENKIAIGDHCPVWDETTQMVHLVFTRNNKDTLYTRSSDHGGTWASPRDISAQADKPDDYWIGTGHAGGLQLPSGRLVIPMHHKGSGCRGILSDDHGATWQQGGIVGGDECQFQQLLNGTLIAVSRQSLGYLTIAYSHDDAVTWTEPKVNKDLLTPIGGCESSILAHPNGKLYHSGPNNVILRADMVVKVSEDSGQTWQKLNSPLTRAAGYSSLVLLGDRSDTSADLGILYERNLNVHADVHWLTFTPFHADGTWLSDALTV